jgi:hypothetical protein
MTYRRVGFLVVAAAAIALAGCALRKPAAADKFPDLPFDPTSIRAEAIGTYKNKGPFDVELGVRATRSITAADDIVLRVVAAGSEIARVPVVIDVAADWNGARSPKGFAATVGVPPGDYEVELMVRGRSILGHAFKIAEVPVWGGGRQVQLFGHIGNRVELDDGRLRLARWVVEDEPTQAFVIEWWHDNRRVWVTRGRTDRWQAYGLDAIVQRAQPRKDVAGVRPTLWTYGAERYAIPKDLILMGGMWEARVYREGAPPVAVAFELSSSPDTQESRVALKRVHLSSELFLRPLPTGLGAAAFAAIPGKQQPTPPARKLRALVEPVAFDRAAIRALFRSPELARKWREFIDANKNTMHDETWNLTADEKAQLNGMRNEDRLVAVKRLRPQIVALLAKLSGPWQPDDVPDAR